MLSDALARIEVRNIFKALLKECVEGMEEYRKTPHLEQYMNAVAGVRMLKILWKELLGEDMELDKGKKEDKPS